MLSNSKKHYIDFLNKNRKCIHSKAGGWIADKGVYSHGYSMLTELVGEKTYFQTFILNATGKLVDKPLADWVEAIYGCLSWPDPRIWCNQIGSLAAEARATVVAGTTAGILANDSKTYGARTLISGMTFIQGALEQLDAGLSVSAIVKAATPPRQTIPNITGYARPLAKGDERIEAMERVSAALKFKTGKHLELAYRIEQFMMEKYDECMNINGYAAAFLSDQGFSPNEVYKMSSTLVMSGVTACYAEAHDKPVNSFLPLRCDDIDYQGPAKRKIQRPE